MSKRKDDGLKDALNDLMGTTQRKGDQSGVPEKPLSDDAGGPTNDSLVTFTLRLPESQKNALAVYFKHEMGLDLGPGIRTVLTKFQREKGI